MSLRQRHNRILRWSLAGAALLHVLVLYLVAWDRPTHVFARDTELVEIGDPGLGGVPVRVLFAPPAITAGPDSVWQEPAGRVLSSEIAVALPPGCVLADLGPTGMGSGVVRLAVSETGHADAVEVVETSGSWCWDGMLGKVAGSLLYRWLPSERFPAPVDVLQPVTVSLVE